MEENKKKQKVKQPEWEFKIVLVADYGKDCTQECKIIPKIINNKVQGKWIKK